VCFTLHYSNIVLARYYVSKPLHVLCCVMLCALLCVYTYMYSYISVGWVLLLCMWRCYIVSIILRCCMLCVEYFGVGSVWTCCIVVYTICYVT